jgi:hypothetical protein
MKRLQQLAGALLMAVCGLAQAHKPSDAYLTLQLQPAAAELRWDIALRDLDRELLLDADDDGALNWGEVRARWDDIEQLAQGALTLRRGDAACTLLPAAARPQLQRHSDGSYAVLRSQWRCPANGAFSIDYRLFAASDPSHRAVTRVFDGEVQLAAVVLVPGAPTRPLAAPLLADRVPASGGIRLADFFTEGIHHIIAGTDHALFLLALLLPAVLVRSSAATAAASGLARPGTPPTAAAIASGRRGRQRGAAALTAGAPAVWIPAPAWGPALREVAGIVTAFTVAHSLTLALSSLDLLRVPSRWVESAIALSIVFAALNNLRPLVQRRLWLLAFAFGLVHGIGFSGVLADVGLSGRAIVPPLLAFNLGVEVGQLMIVGGWLLLAWPLRCHRGYVHFLRWGSAAVATLALVWLAERALLLQILPG